MHMMHASSVGEMNLNDVDTVIFGGDQIFTFVMVSKKFN